MRINIYVDARFGPQATSKHDFDRLGAQMRINIYVDARFQAPKASQDMTLASFGAQNAHQHLC